MAAVDLVADGGDGGEEAGPSFDSWFVGAWPRLVRLAMASARSVQEAEDLASETCVQLLRRWDGDRPDDPTGWAIVALANKGRRLGPRLRRTFGASGAAQPTDVEVHPDLLDAIRTLPRRQRQAIGLRYLADLTQAEVAAAMGIEPGSAAALLHQGRAALRSKLEGR